MMSGRFCEKSRFCLTLFGEHVVCVHCRFASGLCQLDISNPCEV